jgi:hypothetical protein
LSVAGAGEPIARGRDAEVYALGDGRVLRRYRAPGPTGREMRVMAWARSHGYPVPRVYERTETDLILDRLDGPTMLADLARQPSFPNLQPQPADLPSRSDDEYGRASSGSPARNEGPATANGPGWVAEVVGVAWCRLLDEADGDLADTERVPSGYLLTVCSQALRILLDVAARVRGKHAGQAHISGRVCTSWDRLAGFKSRHDAEAPSTVRREGDVEVDLDLVPQPECPKECRVGPDSPSALDHGRPTNDPTVGHTALHHDRLGNAHDRKLAVEGERLLRPVDPSRP